MKLVRTLPWSATDNEPNPHPSNCSPRGLQNLLPCLGGTNVADTMSAPSLTQAGIIGADRHAKTCTPIHANSHATRETSVEPCARRL